MSLRTVGSRTFQRMSSEVLANRFGRDHVLFSWEQERVTRQLKIGWKAFEDIRLVVEGA